MSDHAAAHAADAHHDQGAGHEEHHSHGKTYFMVFCALLVFTLMSIGADFLQMSNKNVLRAIILAVATSKALCVMMYFMHLKFEKAWKYLLLAPTFILAATIPLSLIPDIGSHYYTVDVPQRYEYEAQEAAKKSGQVPVKAEHH